VGKGSSAQVRAFRTAVLCTWESIAQCRSVRRGGGISQGIVETVALRKQSTAQGRVVYMSGSDQCSAQGDALRSVGQYAG
jgi:hypothetical protein